MRTLLIVPFIALAAPALGDTPATAPQTKSCIANFEIRESRTTDAHEIILRTSSKDYWRNTANACTVLKSTTAYVTKSPITRMCDGDIIEVVDLTQNFNYGGCVLGPWERVAKPGR